MKKKHKVVMLPTEKAIGLALGISGVLHLESAHIENNQYRNHNLYILSDEEIKEGEECWLVCKDAITSHLFLSSGGLNHSFGWNEKGTNSFYTAEKCKKVIATTDESLILRQGAIEPNSVDGTPIKLTSLLPQIPESFLPIYVKVYNEANVGGVDVTSLEVKLEVEQNCKMNHRCIWSVSYTHLTLPTTPYV